MNKMLITTAGLAEIVNAEQSGTAPVVLSHVAFGSGQYTATADLTALQSEFKRFDAVAGGAIADNLIHLTIHDNSTDAYTVNEVGVFTASGTLFAVISQTTPIMEKSATSESMLAIDIALTDIDASSISFGDTNLVLNPATTETAGVVELATDAEAIAGTDTTRAMTPAGVKAAVDNQNFVRSVNGTTADSAGNVEITTGIENTATGTNSLTLGGTPCSESKGTNVGVNSSAGQQAVALGTGANAPYASVAIGEGAGAMQSGSVAIGRGSWVVEGAQNAVAIGGRVLATGLYAIAIQGTADGQRAIALGTNSSAEADEAIQIGRGTNSTANTMQVWDYTLLDKSTGLIPAERMPDMSGAYLPKSGGAMTATKAITRDVSDSYLGLHGGTGTDNDGAQLDLCGSEHSSMPGTFQLHARNGDIDMILRGQTDGTLRWDSKYVLNNSFSMPSNGSGVVINGGTDYESGGYMRVYGKDHATYPGWFTLGASDGTNSSALRGLPDGTLTWQAAGTAMNVSAMSMPSGTYTDLTLGASGSTYTAPADGWFYINKVAGSTGYYVSAHNKNTGLMGTNMAGMSGQNGCQFFVPAKKGDVVQVNYTATGATTAFRFIYAEGAKHLAS